LNKNKVILGSALSIAALAVAIDHTKHRVPVPQQTEQGIIIIEGNEEESPCGMGESTAGQDNETPCGM